MINTKKQKSYVVEVEPDYWISLSISVCKDEGMERNNIHDFVIQNWSKSIYNSFKVKNTVELVFQWKF